MAARRAPYGARGLKLLIGGAIGIFGRSRPVWGAWIEIWPYIVIGLMGVIVAPRMGRVD